MDIRHCKQTFANSLPFSNYDIVGKYKLCMFNSENNIATPSNTSPVKSNAVNIGIILFLRCTNAKALIYIVFHEMYQKKKI